MMNTTVTKRYQIPMRQNESKGRMHLTDDLDALIYFYPNGQAGKSKPGYAASDVQLQILTKHYQHQNETIEIIWKCGKKTKSQTCSIRRYIEPEKEIALGFHTLFLKQHIEENKGIIKVRCIMKPSQEQQTNTNQVSSTSKVKCYDNTIDTNQYSNNNVNMKSNSIQQQKVKNTNIKTTLFNTNDTNNSNNKKRKIQTILDYPSFKKPKLNTNHNKTNNGKSKNYNNKNDWKFNPNKLNEAIKQISDKLGADTMFDYIPTIDCFSSDKNYQKICKKYITKQDDFFATKYDSSEFWRHHVAWCNPPFHRKTIVMCINKFKPREMRGYVCVPYYPETKYNWQKEKWLRETQKICKVFINMKGKGDHNAYFPVTTGNNFGISACPFDTVIFYFDYQESINNH